MLKKDLAEQLGISPAMVSRLSKRGMPTDTLERAQRWRKRHLEPGRVKGSRFDPNAQASERAPVIDLVVTNWESQMASPLALAADVELGARFAGIALNGNDAQAAADMVAEVRELVRKLPLSARPKMPLCVWVALTDWLLSDTAPARRHPDQNMVLDPEGFAALVSEYANGRDFLGAALDINDFALRGYGDSLEDHETAAS